MKRSIMLAFVVAAIVAMSTVSLGVDTATQFGTDGFDFAWAAAADASGTYVAGGTHGAFPGESSGGGSDAFLAHVAQGGDVDWIRQFGGAGTDTANGVTAAAEGGVYVVGDDDLASGPARGFLRRYTSGGDLAWSRRIEANEDTYALGVAADGAGVYVVGETFGTVARRSRGRMDLFLRRYDLDGNVVWTRQFGTEMHDNAGHAVALAGDSLYITMTSGDVGSVYRFDTEGDRRWRTTLGPVFFLYGAAADASGMFLAGATGGQAGGDVDALAISIGPQGHVRWRSRFGEQARNSWDTAGPVVIDGDRVFVAGDTSGDLTRGGTQQTDDYDAFVRAFDPLTGEGRRTWQFGSPELEYGNGAAIREGDLTVVGATRGAFPGETAMGDWDAYAYRL